MTTDSAGLADLPIVQIADRYVEAYNDGDLDTLTSLISDGIRLWHHNKELSLQGRDAVTGFFMTIKSAFPDRRFTDRRGIYEVGDQVIIEHTWTGTAATDLAGLADRGTTVRLEGATFLRFDNGLITEYHDYA
jgi:steroid delta-isomerase-like uncharacterized protein